MRALIISGDTLEKQDWDIENILSKDDSINRILDYNWNNKLSRCGLTYGEIEELDRISYEQMAYEEMLGDCR